ncbi:MAG: M20/M25/M40 family metallo-hydrolase [Planctomycetes bacterium]|nr:M20/M25/M40 family metallo-hydrolase [Planctomycetota bacterium]
MKRSLLSCAILCIVVPACTVTDNTGSAVDLDVVARIRAEGLDNSQVMQTLSDLVDRHGPRLAGSPNYKAAAEWCRGQFEDWGLENAQLESWGTFGRGWELKRFSLEMTEPYHLSLIAHPKAWTSGTDGEVSVRPVLVDAESIEDLEQYEGKLKGAIVLTPLGRQVETTFRPDATRYNEEELLVLANADGARPDRARGRRGSRTGRGGGGDRSARREAFRARRALRRRMSEFFREEGVVAVLGAGRGAHGTLFVSSGGSRAADAEPAPTSLVLAVEHHGLISRLLEKGVEVMLRLRVDAEFLDETEGYNVVAEIPGSDPELKDELVMLGGHLDSWHSATGTTDNAVGCAVAMEAVRILKAIGVKPRRTIRVALWDAEERGLLGSRAYVKKHFGDRATMELKPEHEQFSGYFNLDNGTGRIRGIYCQGNAAVRPIFTKWLKPFHDLDATTVTIRNTGGTDHQSFDGVGLPGFQFIQDRIDYNTRTHHTNMDTYERAIDSDLMQASVIMASFVYNTAMRDEKLPRKPLPEPRPPRESSDSRP